MSVDRRRARRWAVYVRISKDDLAEGLGVDRQEFLCRALLDDRGLAGTIVGVYADNDRSAYDGQGSTRRRKPRPDYDRLRDDIKNGIVDGILALKSDRIARDDLRGIEDLIDLLNDRDVAVETVRSGTFDLASAHGRAQARMAGVWARLESETMSERLRDKHDDLARRGLPSGGPRPFGYEPDAITPRLGEAEVVREIVERVAAGESNTAISDSLNERGVRTATGIEWKQAVVGRIATNPRYVGRRIHNGVDVGPAAWPALVDEATFRRAVALRSDTARNGRRRPRRNLLAGGMILCGNPGCGARLYGKRYDRPAATGERVYGYLCRSPKYGGCGGISVRADYVEDLVRDYVCRIVEGPEYGASLARLSGVDSDAAADVAEIEEELAELIAAKAAGSFKRIGEYLEIRAGIDDRLDAARKRLGGDVASAATLPYAGKPGALADDWDGLSLDQRQAIVRAVIRPVVVRPNAAGAAGRFDPERVAIERLV